MNKYGDNNKHLLKIDWVSAMYFDGLTTVNHILIQGVTYIYNNGNYTEGATNMAIDYQSGKGFLISFSYNGSIELDGYIAEVSLNISSVS